MAVLHLPLAGLGELGVAIGVVAFGSGAGYAAGIVVGASLVASVVPSG